MVSYGYMGPGPSMGLGVKAQQVATFSCYATRNKLIYIPWHVLQK